MSMEQDRPQALVTGASSGIGLELVRQFANNGFDVIAAAEDDSIHSVVGELAADQARITAVQADLATYDGVEQLWGAVTATGRPLAAAAINAGVGAGGDFAQQTDLSDELRLIDLNVKHTVHLGKRVLRHMVERGEGRVLFTSSIASTMPGPYQAVYNASKSFVQSFAEGVRAEVADSGVTVTSLMPGPTATDFFRRAGLGDTALGQSKKDDPAQVAEQGFQALMAGKQKIVAGGLMTKAQGLSNKMLPDSVKALAHRKMAAPGSGKD